ncbi:gamma-glutamyltransferase [Verminephrobacter aporrectodeae subsp. tuberculatae]|uniref:gamma-glutamyltransferase n=1 Tax=Verminephrobacter aporrectodeae TaxID=1110389 RepID=UPI00224481A2|nr:gamma-glutamyltransferase [Verminephrobacter aporrectodeae]MCW8208499.1 gamma-glutamyltransferase [Verminephrobacter aporrectodeae subsp. tuberculatae]
MNIRHTLLSSSIALALASLSACGNAPPAVSAAALARQTAAAPYDLDMDRFHPVVARNGMVASEQELASRVGLDILRAGGNAVDAAVGVGFALAVVLPNAGNLGGGGFMLLHETKTGQSVALDFREIAPRGARRDMYLDAQGQVIQDKSLYTHYAVGVPGTVAGMEHALKRWGTMPLEKVIAPAIALADQGFPVSETLARVLQQEQKIMGPWPATRAIFWKNGAPLKAGDLLVQEDLAQSMRLIAQQGAKAFYEGEIAQKIAAEMAPHAGAITLQDLRAYQVVERAPTRGIYRGYEIVTMPPPSSGGAHLVQMLNMLEPLPLAQWGANSAQTIHYLAESMKLAYADRAEYLGDPDFVRIPLKGLTSKRYAQTLAKGIDGNAARPGRSIAPGRPQAYESDQTTHYSVVDKAGNAVAVTYTLNTNFGSGIVAQGTGIMLNNEMDDFSAKPGVANAYGLVGGEANAVAAGKRPLSSMTPTVVLKDGKPTLVTGSPGGARIITTVLQTVLNIIDFGMTPAEAAASPRVHHQWTPDELRVEKGLSPDTLALLRQRGHSIAVKPAMGRTQTIQLRDGILYGNSDPRNPDGKTLGY